jgi:hypothetical protein
MDLEPVCGAGAERAQLVSSPVADACHVLRSAIADVRNIIHHDGLMDLLKLCRIGLATAGRDLP